MSKASDFCSNFNEDDLDDADLHLLGRRVNKQYDDTAKDILNKAFGPDPEPGQVTDNIRVGTYTTPRAQRSIRNYYKDDASFFKLLHKLDRDTSYSKQTITPQWAREIAMRMLGDKYQRLPRLGYEMDLGKIPVKSSDTDTASTHDFRKDLDIWGDAFAVTLTHDSYGYHVTLRRTR